MKTTTRNTLLVTVATAALMVGAGLASAQDAKQDTKQNHEAPAAAAHDQKAPAGKTEQQPSSLPQKSPPPTAQAPTKEKPTAQAPMKEKPTTQAQQPAASDPATTGHGSVGHDSMGHGSTEQTSESPKPHMAPSAAKDETKSGPPAALSTEQHGKIRDALRDGKAERLSNVHFSTTVGGVIPETIHLYRLPVSIVEYAPQYRDYEYILVGDEILIVDPSTLRIVAVIAA